MSEPRSSEVAGIILAGGQSRRMGVDKAALIIDGRSVLDRTIGALRELTGEVIVAGRDVPFAGVRSVPDAAPDSGPLGGLIAALRATTAPLVLVVGCDMPALDIRALRAMLMPAPGHDAVVPRHDGQIHPLHAVYARSVLPIAEEQLAAGDFRLRHFLARLTVCWLDVTDQAFARSLTNVNTPEEWQQARGYLGEV
jgi:molybdopterin-guanine dinucleotide biosynthesis protein A